MLKQLMMCLIGCMASLHGVEIEEWGPVGPAPSYEIVDLGAAGEASDLLSKYALPYSLAPTINNNRQISFNRDGEGIVRDLASGEWAPHVGQLPGKCYAINNHGDVLVSVERPRDSSDWLIWQQKLLRDKRQIRINTHELAGPRVYLRALNDKKMAVGSLNPEGALRPAVWTPEKGFQNLGSYLGWDVVGVLWGVNQNGTVVGRLQNDEDNPPFTWSAKDGLNILRDYTHAVEVKMHLDGLKGKIHFEDAVIAPDNSVYGTFWVDAPDVNIPGKIYFAYHWEPVPKNFRLMNVKGMRFNAINDSHLLVGSLEGQAAYREKGGSPQVLKNNIPNLSADWELVEATDVNDRGDIVGYGNYQGAIHLFLLLNTKKF